VNKFEIAAKTPFPGLENGGFYQNPEKKKCANRARGGEVRGKNGKKTGQKERRNQKPDRFRDRPKEGRKSRTGGM